MRELGPPVLSAGLRLGELRLEELPFEWKAGRPKVWRAGFDELGWVGVGALVSSGRGPERGSEAIRGSTGRRGAFAGRWRCWAGDW